MVDVALQIYLFKSPEKNTHYKFLRRCLCKVLATIAIMVVMSIPVSDDVWTGVWDAIIVTTMSIWVLFMIK